MSSTKSIIHLRVYYSSRNGSGKDTDIFFDAQGKINNENILVKLMHNTLEWANYLKNIRGQGFIKATVEKVIGKDAKKAIQKEVDEAMNPTVTKVLTPEQKEIAELKTIVHGLQKESNFSEQFISDVEASKNENPDLSKEADLKLARTEYQTKFGKKGHYTWSVEKIREKIKAA